MKKRSSEVGAMALTKANPECELVWGGEGECVLVFEIGGCGREREREREGPERERVCVHVYML